MTPISNIFVEDLMEIGELLNECEKFLLKNLVSGAETERVNRKHLLFTRSVHSHCNGPSVQMSNILVEDFLKISEFVNSNSIENLQFKNMKI